MNCDLSLTKSDSHRFSLSNVLKSHISLWRTGLRPVTFCIVIQTFICMSDMIVLSSMMTALEPLLPVSVHYHNVDCPQEK